MSESYYKKQKEIFNLKNILFNLTNKSVNLHSKIQIMQDIFKASKKIISQKITQLIKIDSNPKITEGLQSQKQSIYKEIISDLESIVKKYSLKETVGKLKKELKLKSRDIQGISKKYNYSNLIDEKNFITYAIQEKKNIYEYLRKSIENETKFEFLFTPKNEVYLSDIYEISTNDNFNIEMKKEKLLKTKYLKKINTEINIKNNKNYSDLNTYFTELKNQKTKQNKEYKDFIKKNELKFKFNNSRHCHQYAIEIEPINNYNDSSSSDSEDSEESDSNEPKYLLNKNSDKSNSDSFNSTKIMKKKKNSDLSDKETSYKSNLDPDGNKKNKINNNINNTQNEDLINELVKIKEKYNQLIQEKYELDNKKKIKYQKILEIKSRIKKMDFLNLPMEFNSEKIKKNKNSIDKQISVKHLNTYKMA